MKTVKYSEVRYLLKSGDLILFNGNWISLFSKRFSLRKFSACGIVVKLGNRFFVVKCTNSKKIGLFSLSRLMPFYWIKLDGKWSPSAEEELFKYVYGTKKIPYKNLCAAILGMLSYKTENCHSADKLADHFLNGDKELVKIVR